MCAILQNTVKLENLIKELKVRHLKYSLIFMQDPTLLENL